MTVALGGASARFAPALGAQETGALPPVFAALEGTWEGSGTLFGRPAAFRMRWESAGDGFVRLTFSNAFRNDSTVVPVLTSRAVYYIQNGSAAGVWLDNRPQRVQLRATVTDSSLVTHWTAESEEGRTEYVIRSADAVVVRDFVYVDDAERPFAEATYRRVESVPRE